MRKKPQLILTEREYCHLINKITGHVILVEGPYRKTIFRWWWKLYGEIQQKIIVQSDEYAVILNPFNKDSQQLSFGSREVREGPCIFSLHPGELVENDKIQSEIILTKEEGLVVRAIHDFIDEGLNRIAGEVWLIKGPKRYIPPLFIKIIQMQKAISLGNHEGIYVKDVQTGEVHLERGPQALLIEPFQEVWNKSYSESERKALKIGQNYTQLFRAIPLHLNTLEYALILKNDIERIEIGPKIFLLEPDEKLKILSLSGDTPKRPNVLYKWKVFVGPMFVSDKLCVRTKDNAELSILLRYKTRFRLNSQTPAKIFQVEDFIGYATETMAGIIRQEAAQHDFEALHSNAAELIKSKISLSGESSYTFKENGFEIFDMDIKKIIPEDPEIAAQLNAAIKSNMEIYVHKLEQIAQLEAERTLVEGKIEIENSKKLLLQKEQENYRYEMLEKAKVRSDVKRVDANAEAEAQKIIQKLEIQLEKERNESLSEILEKATGEKYLQLQQIKSFEQVEKTLVVPTDSKLFLPFPSEPKCMESKLDEK